MSSSRDDDAGRRRDGSRSIATAVGKGEGYDGNTREFPTYKKLVIAALSTSGRMKYMRAPRTTQIELVKKKITLAGHVQIPSTTTPPSSSTEEKKSKGRRSLGPELHSYDSVVVSDDDKLSVALEALDNVLYGISLFVMNTLDLQLKKQFSRACDLDDPFTLWESLEERFDSRSTTDYTATMQELLAIKLLPKESVFELTIRMTSLASALTHINAVPPDPIMVHLLKQALPPTFKLCIAHMSHQYSDGGSYTFITATKVLVDEEARLKLDDLATANLQSPVGHHRAYTATIGGPTHRPTPRETTSHSKDSTSRACYRCADTHHLANQCPIPPKDLQCTICHKAGHNAKACIIKGSGNHTDRTAHALTCIVIHDEPAIQSKAEWIVDSGATRHMTPHLHHLINIRPIPAVAVHSAASGATPLSAVQCGTASIHTSHGTLVIHGVLYHPQLAFNLVSVSCLVDAGHSIAFASDSCTIRKRDARLNILAPYSTGGGYTITDGR